MRTVRLLLVGLLVAVGLGALAAPAVAYPSGQVATAQINSTVFAPGATVVVTVEHTTPGSLSMAIFSAPVTIGTGTVGANFSGSVTGTIPAGYSGPHTIQVTGAGGESFAFSITVTGATPTSVITSVTVAPDCTSRTAAATVTINGIGFLTVIVVGDGGSASADSPATNGTVNVFVSGIPLLATQTSLRIDLTGPVEGDPVYDTARVSFASCSGSTSPTTTPTTPPSGTTSSAAATVTASGTRVSGQPGGGTLASTGAQVALGSGVGFVALLAGGVLLLVSRRRSVPRHGG